MMRKKSICRFCAWMMSILILASNYQAIGKFEVGDFAASAGKH